MRAWQILSPDGPDALQFRETDSHPCRGREIRVSMASTALNRADLLQTQGRYPVASEGPAIPGLEFSGRVIEVGPEAGRFAVGSRVMGLTDGGAFAEEVVVDERLLIAVPEGFSVAEAGAFPEAQFTAYDALVRQGGLAPGDKVLIHAAGSGVGTAAIRIAKLLGAEVAVSASPGKHARLRDLGADLCVDSRQPEDLDALRAFAGKSGFAVILDLLGAGWLRANIEVAGVGARMIVIGLLTGAKTELDLLQLMKKRMTIRGSLLRPRSIEEKGALIADFERDLAAALDAGLLRPVIDRIHDFEALPAAFETMKSNENFGKIAIVRDQEKPS